MVIFKKNSDYKFTLASETTDFIDKRINQLLAQMPMTISGRTERKTGEIDDLQYKDLYILKKVKRSCKIVAMDWLEKVLWYNLENLDKIYKDV